MDRLNLVRFLLFIIAIVVIAKISEHFFPEVNFYFLLFVFIVTAISGETIRQKFLNNKEN